MEDPDIIIICVVSLVNTFSYNFPYDRLLKGTHKIHTFNISCNMGILLPSSPEVSDKRTDLGFTSPPFNLRASLSNTWKS